MKFYHILFLALKTLLVIQTVLVALNKHKMDSKSYLINEIAFKTLLGLFIQYLMFYTHVHNIDLEDRIILSFSGGILLVDAFTNDVPELLKIWGSD
jgi:hypothetical protein